MPRTSPYEIRLSSAELEQLEGRAGKYTLPYFQVQRAKMILVNDHESVNHFTFREVSETDSFEIQSACSA
jgi:hypothetical protein